MWLNDLPTELLYSISDLLRCAWDLSSLFLVNHRFRDVFKPILYKYTKESTLRWAVSCRLESPDRIWLVEGLLGVSVAPIDLTEQLWNDLILDAARN
ncbi:ankyrin repeat protein [Aspergillus undulatus]|uniref:ankyrin repeat protein n=1 Tax=Aspergillus undulatus TaxID=1810928 RepID=UPI003CCC9DD0